MFYPGILGWNYCHFGGGPFGLNTMAQSKLIFLSFKSMATGYPMTYLCFLLPSTKTSIVVLLSSPFSQEKPSSHIQLHQKRGKTSHRHFSIRPFVVTNDTFLQQRSPSLSYLYQTVLYRNETMSLTQNMKNLPYKGLESDPSKSPLAQQHFATVLDFH